MSDDYEHSDEARRALINYVLGTDPAENGFLGPYLSLMPHGAQGEQEHLVAILTTLAPPSDESQSQPIQPNPALLYQQPLDLTHQVVMNEGPGRDFAEEFDADWGGVENAVQDFEKAAEVFRKHCWALPGRLGEPGVSLYEEFKLLSALVHASGGNPQPAKEFTLIAGDFPGVQRVIYSISSKGATKGLRGRSFFLQLLGDAVVRRLLYKFRLPWTNVIYSAGGNFVLLAGSGVEHEVEEIGQGFNDRLLESFSGDISLSLACESIGNHDLHGENFVAHWKSLKQVLGSKKQQPFYQQAATNWSAVFDPSGIGTDRNCSVCHREPESYDLDTIDQLTSDEDWVCNECQTFESLARDIASNNRFLSVCFKPDETIINPWENLLHYISDGFWYQLHQNAPNASERQIYALNITDFVDHGATGFRFVATKTPLDWTGAIRDFETLAEDSTGISRIGILRMDVDNLGRIFGSYIHKLSLTRYSAASSAMSLFFDGWLNEICKQFEVEHEAEDSIYVIYAGGDDLFIVGPWNLMPLLAERIQGDLAEYVNGNPHITISAGISITDPHYPLYRSAELARMALDDQAKGRTGKNAIAMLGQVVGWDGEWERVIVLRQEIDTLIDAGIPKALVQILLNAHVYYAQGKQQAQTESWWQPGQLYYGRWHWMLAYSLTRLAARYRDKVPQSVTRVQSLQEILLNARYIHQVGLAARWVDYLKRERQGEV